MPTLSRYFVRSALLSLGMGFTLGGVLLLAKAGVLPMRVWGWLPLHIVLLMDGWLTQVALGVAYWIMPRIHLHERGRQAWAWASFLVLQIGLGLTLMTTLTLWQPAIQIVIVPAIVAHILAVMLFACHAWPRIRPTFVGDSRARAGQG